MNELAPLLAQHGLLLVFGFTLGLVEVHFDTT
jgi:hypothetical protein